MKYLFVSTRYALTETRCFTPLAEGGFNCRYSVNRGPWLGPIGPVFEEGANSLHDAYTNVFGWTPLPATDLYFLFYPLPDA